MTKENQVQTDLSNNQICKLKNKRNRGIEPGGGEDYDTNSFG